MKYKKIMQIDNYFPYIISAYGVAVFIMAFMFIKSLWQARSLEKQLKSLEKSKKR